MNIMGGICLDNHKIVYKEAEKINEDSIAAFLQKLRNEHKDIEKVHVIWDNAGYHSSEFVITSYSIHYTKLYEIISASLMGSSGSGNCGCPCVT